MPVAAPPQDTGPNRRRFVGAATLAAALTTLTSGARAATPALSSAGSATFNGVKQIDAGLLNVGYVEMGPSDGPVVMLLHGWPYDIHAFAEVAPTGGAGYRVIIVPHLRGHGTTRFLSATTRRNGQQAVLALDAIALMDALGSSARSSPVSTGARGRPTSWPRCGPSAARRWSRSAAI
jgi:hypothetical protein